MTVRILTGDARVLTPTLEQESVHMVWTSPPYYGLRDYSVRPLVWDGKETCRHRWGASRRRGGPAGAAGKTTALPGRAASDSRGRADDDLGCWCQRCGAWRGSLGLEPSPELYVTHLVDIFRLVRRALRKDGTLWLNIGDCYATGAGTVGNHPGGGDVGRHRDALRRDSTRPAVNGRGEPQAGPTKNTARRPRTQPNRLPLVGYKPKDLIGIPWMLAFALRADGWWLRAENIWSKRNAMPESVRDRTTRAHEHLFMLTKSRKYYYDADAIAEEAVTASEARWDPGTNGLGGGDRNTGRSTRRFGSGNKERKFRKDFGGVEGGRGHQGFGVPRAVDGAHRPQYQRALELAKEKGLTSAHLEAIRACGGITDTERGAAQAGAGRNREEVQRLAAEAKEALGGYYREFLLGGKRNKRSVWTLASQPYKGAHYAVAPPALIEPCVLAGCPHGGVVLDPFGGAGTTGLVCERNGRDSILMELSPAHAKQASQRIRDEAPLLTLIVE